MRTCTPHELFEKWAAMTVKDRAEFRRLCQKHKNFKQNLEAVIDILKKHGPEAAMCAAKGDQAGAVAAAEAYHAKKKEGA